MLRLSQVQQYIISRLPMTGIRMALAQIIYRFLHLFVKRDIFYIRRRGINFAVDLSEAFDLSLFLGRNFQHYIVHNRFLSWPEDADIIDVGANAGIMSLEFAQKTPRGRVFAFEPTDYARHRFARNLALNPDLSSRISLIPALVAAVPVPPRDLEIYAGWPVTVPTGVHRHPVHRGIRKPALGVYTITLDDYFLSSGKAVLNKLAVIKIDTDGWEWEVLQGGQQLIALYGPVVIFEYGLYLEQERGIGFEKFCDFFLTHGYKMYNAQSGHAITRENFPGELPRRYAIDILAIKTAPCL